MNNPLSMTIKDFKVVWTITENLNKRAKTKNSFLKAIG